MSRARGRTGRAGRLLPYLLAVCTLPAAALSPGTPAAVAQTIEVQTSETPGMAEFEVQLQQQAPASYVLYRRLDDDGKRAVFDEYATTGAFSSVRQKIIDLAKQQR